MAIKPIDEWIKQAGYDLGTAEHMFKSGRYIYVVFMCHLSIEKALKGFYAESAQKEPPKTHDLVFLSEKARLKLPDRLMEFLDRLNNASVPTRYPDELKRLLKQYNKRKTSIILNETKDLLAWLKRKIQKK